jgi:histone-lysine N-methyltransferase SETD1
VRGSKIHGWGLFADQKFAKGDCVAEYIGEYVTNSVADARESSYQARRIQDYQFRVDEKLVIDATLKGGNGRYINHNCNPNCFSKIMSGSDTGSVQRKRVLFVALRDIEINEEITYDYQFPLEMNLQNRIPCNCHSDDCRGFMNWDIPEKGSNRALLIQKRGANMRDRIRRLGRPLKRDEGLNE